MGESPPWVQIPPPPPDLSTKSGSARRPGQSAWSGVSGLVSVASSDQVLVGHVSVRRRCAQPATGCTSKRRMPPCLRSASLVGHLNSRQVQVSLTRQALSRIQALCQVTIRERCRLVRRRPAAPAQVVSCHEHGAREPWRRTVVRSSSAAWLTESNCSMIGPSVARDGEAPLSGASRCLPSIRGTVVRGGVMEAE